MSRAGSIEASALFLLICPLIDYLKADWGGKAAGSKDPARMEGLKEGRMKWLVEIVPSSRPSG